MNIEILKFKYVSLEKDRVTVDSILGKYKLEDISEYLPLTNRLLMEFTENDYRHYAYYVLKGQKRRGGYFMITTLRKINDSNSKEEVYYGDIREDKERLKSFLIVDFRAEGEMLITVFCNWMPRDNKNRLMFVKQFSFWQNYSNIYELLFDHGINMPE